MSEQKPWADWQIFGDENADHECCSCCNGYCPLDAEPSGHWLPDDVVLYAFTTHAGIRYITDRASAIRGDLVRSALRPIELARRPDWAVPPTQPGPSTALFAAQYVARLTACGLTLHQGEGDGRSRQHVYLGDEHVGWLMPVLEAAPHRMRIDDISRVRALAEDLPPLGGHTHPWEAAAILLNSASLRAALEGAP